MRCLGSAHFLCLSVLFLVTVHLSNQPVLGDDLLFDFVSGPTVDGTDSVSLTSGAVTVQASTYVAQFGGGNSTVFGPFPVSSFVTGTRWDGFDVGLFLLSQPLSELAVSGSDRAGGGVAPGFDNHNRANSVEESEFALFVFSQPVPVKRVTVDDASNFGRAIWAAGGNAAPVFGNGLANAFPGYTILNSPDTASDGLLDHDLSGLGTVKYLVIGSPPSSAVGQVGQITPGDSQFFINRLTTGVPEPASMALLGLCASALWMQRRRT